MCEDIEVYRMIYNVVVGLIAIITMFGIGTLIVMYLDGKFMSEERKSIFMVKRNDKH